LIIRNISWNWLGLVISGLAIFIMTPILVHSLGSFYYGLWVLVNAIIGYYGLLDLGLTPTLQRFVSHMDGQGNRVGLNETFSSAIALSSGIGLMIFFLILAATRLPPGLFHVQAQEWRTAQRLLLVMGGAICFNFPGRTVAAYMRGIERFDATNFVSISVTVLQSVTIIVFLRLGFGILSVAWITFAYSTLSIALNLTSVFHCDRDLRFSLVFVDVRRVRELLNYSFFVFLITVADTLRVNMDSVVIGVFIGVAQITPFSVVSTLMLMYFKAVSTMWGPVDSRLTRLNGSGDWSATLAFLYKSTRMTALIALFMTFVLLIDGKSLIVTWMGQKFAYVYPILVVLAVAYIADTSQHPSMQLILARAAHKPMAGWMVAEGVCNLVLSIWLARRMGLIGVAIGTAIPSVIVRLFVQPTYVLLKFRIPGWEYFKSGPLRPVALALFFVGAFLALRLPTISHYGELGLLVALQGVLYFGAAYIAVLDTRERKSIRSGIQRLMSWVMTPKLA
jgi:O-antigen/teichoic acid export membrane protein